MAKLIQRLQDPARSGVYRASRIDPIVDAVRGSKLSFARIALRDVKDKAALLDRIAQTLAFPSWFGGNWDALEDCLTDLSWCEAPGHVFAFEGFQFLPAGDIGVLTDVLITAAEFWPERGRSFFAVFVDPERTLLLADLFNET
jgi:Barstar (barnase inhibitor)